MKPRDLFISTTAFVLCLGCAVAKEIGEKPYAADSNIVKQPEKRKNIDPLSVQTLYLILADNKQVLGTATGFVVEKNKKYYLITNWHVVSGRHPATDQPMHPSGALPSKILIWHNGQSLGNWVRKEEALYDAKGKRRWLEHKTGSKVDVVALPLETVDKQVKVYPFDLSMADNDMQVFVATSVSIIGFPLGFAGPGLLPIWKTGHIASEPELDYNGEPLFLIDATTRAGMSGSPVVSRQVGGYTTTSGGQVIGTGIFTRFLGVYSGRLSDDSEIGRVWRPILIKEILDQP